MDREKMTVLERHAQTVLVLILVALLLWVGNTTQRTAVAVAEMRVEIVYLRAAVDDPVERIRSLEQRVRILEQRVERESRE